MAKTIALLLGVVFVAAGAAGFVPNPIIGAEGMFMTNQMHDFIHLGTGLVLIVAAVLGFAKLALLVGGLGYGAIAAAGFFMKDEMLFGIIHNTANDRYLHVGLALVMLVSGFLLGGKKAI
jgi:hypothetical protein